MITSYRATGFLAICVGLAAIVGAAGSMDAAIIDLTTVGSSGTINGAIYEQTDAQSTGTGTVRSFAQINPQGNDTTSRGYNTTVNDVLNNGMTDEFNRSIFVGDVPIHFFQGDFHRQFILDVNENAGGQDPNEYLSLDEVQIFIGGTENASFDTFDGDGVLEHDGSLIYRMDTLMEDNTVALNYALNSGSGAGDMFLYVPNSLFAPFADTDVVTLYSAFGDDLGVNPGGGLPDGDYGQSASFEEWAHGDGGIPEPASALLLLVGLAMAGARRRR